MPLLNPSEGQRGSKFRPRLQSLPVKILLCHTKMMDCQCCGVLLYVGLGDEWALAMVLHVNFTIKRVPCHS